jgi:hypothetical protein
MRNAKREIPSLRAAVQARSLPDIVPGMLTLCVLLLWAALSSNTAEANSRIYKTVDENGNVVFTDVPPRPDQQGEEVQLTAPSSFSPEPTGRQQQSLEDWLGTADNPAADDEEESASPYNMLQVASPADDEGLRDNAGNVTVTATVVPALQPDHVMQLYLDGELAQSGPTTTFQLSNVDRGTHNLELRIVSSRGDTLISSPASVFHLQRRSVINQPAPARRTSN